MSCGHTTPTSGGHLSIYLTHRRSGKTTAAKGVAIAKLLGKGFVGKGFIEDFDVQPFTSKPLPIEMIFSSWFS